MYIGGLLAALVVLAEGLHAQAPRAEATLDTAAARVGDPIRLTLTLHHDATARPEAPDLSQILRDFAPRCAGWNQREVAAGFELAQECELRLYELGLHEVPAVAVPFVTAAGDTLLRATQPLAIEVISARSEGDDQPRDIKPPVRVSGGVPLWVVVVIGLLALVLCALGGVWLWRRRTRPLEPPPPPEPIDYAAEFARIAACGLLERGEFKTYYSLLAENLRCRMTCIKARSSITACRHRESSRLPRRRRWRRSVTSRSPIRPAWPRPARRLSKTPTKPPP